MIENLHTHNIERLLYSNPGESPVYAIIGREPPNLWEIMDKINEIIDYLNSNDKEANNEQVQG